MGVLERISSFAAWPLNTSTSPLSLANAGFMYTGELDKVRCPLCRLEIAGCLEEPSHDQSMPLHPRDVHRLRSPQCQLALECSKPDSEVISAVRNNVWQREVFSVEAVGQTNRESQASLSNEAKNLSVLQTGQKPSENAREILKHALDRASRQVPVCEKPEVTNNPVQRTVVVDRTNPDYNQLKMEIARLSTYYDWPSTALVKPEELAANGFFFTGRTDRVCCAFCQGILHRWSPGDTPSAEHRRHFPHCPFVKGKNVDNVPADRWYSSPGAVSVTTGSCNPAAMKSYVEIGQSCSGSASVTATGTNYASSSQCGEQTQQRTKELTVPNSAEKVLSIGDDEEQHLLMENQRLVETLTCKVCLDRAVNTVFLPCGHLVACDECSPKLRNCPICRTYIRGTVKTCLS